MKRKITNLFMLLIIVVYIALKIMLPFITKESKITDEEKAQQENNIIQLVLDLGLSYQLQGNTEKAMEAYNKVLEYNKEVSLAWHRLSILYIEEGLFDEALATREKVVQLDPEEAPAYSYYSTILFLYDTEKALEMGNKFCKLATENQDLDKAYIENYQRTLNTFEAAYNAGDLYSAYTTLINSDIHVDPPIELEVINRLLTSVNLSSKEVSELESLRGSIEKGGYQ